MHPAADRRNAGRFKILRVHDLTGDGGHRTAADSGVIPLGGIFYSADGKFRVHTLLSDDKLQIMLLGIPKKGGGELLGSGHCPIRQKCKPLFVLRQSGSPVIVEPALEKSLWGGAVCLKKQTVRVHLLQAGKGDKFAAETDGLH